MDAAARLLADAERATGPLRQALADRPRDGSQNPPSFERARPRRRRESRADGDLVRSEAKGFDVKNDAPAVARKTPPVGSGAPVPFRLDRIQQFGERLQHGLLGKNANRPLDNGKTRPIEHAGEIAAPLVGAVGRGGHGSLSQSESYIFACSRPRINGHMADCRTPAVVCFPCPLNRLVGDHPVLQSRRNDARGVRL